MKESEQFRVAEVMIRSHVIKRDNMFCLVCSIILKLRQLCKYAKNYTFTIHGNNAQTYSGILIIVYLVDFYLNAFHCTDRAPEHFTNKSTNIPFGEDIMLEHIFVRSIEL